MKKKLGEYDRSPSGMIELWERVEEEWNKIDAVVCQNLIESMPRRVEAVILNTSSFVGQNWQQKNLSNDIAILTDLYHLHIWILLHNIVHPESRDARACYQIMWRF